jgi:hypothetical protein
MNNLNTKQTRKHPGGVQGFVTTLSMLFYLGLIFCSVLIVGATVTMFSANRKAKIESNRSVKEHLSVETGTLRSVKHSATYTFKARNVGDWLLCDTPYFPNLITGVLGFMILYQSYKIFGFLKIDQPFSFVVSSRIRYLGLLIIGANVFELLQGLWVKAAISDLTNSQFKAMKSDLGVSLGTGIVLLIIAEVYTRACVLQEEKELTI